MPKLIMHTCYLLVGLPGSGKTTFRKSIIKKYKLEDKPIGVLSTDDFIEAKAAMTGQTYREQFKSDIKEAEKQMYADLTMDLKNGFDIIFDQTNLSKKTRRKKLALIPKEYTKIAIVVTATPEELNKRNAERALRGREIGQTMFDSMLKSFEMPTKDEGFDEIKEIKN